MLERNLAKELALLATDVDSLAKTLSMAQAERARDAERCARADAKAEELRQQLGHARRRAKIAERELAKLSADVGAKAHAAQSRERELGVQLEQAQQTNEVLKHEVERVERDRRALQLNLREVLANLRHAAQDAAGSRVTTDQETLVPAEPADSGW
jgi:chromosome segregation ATPase